MPILQDEGSSDILFEQDGVPLHFCLEVRGLLNCQFPRKVDMGGPVTWLSSSPNVTSVDFSFGMHYRCYVCTSIGYHFAGTCQVDKGCDNFIVTPNL
jgi:hypothetical protein